MVTTPIDIQQNLPNTNLTGLARFLVRNSLLNETSVLRASEEAKKEEISLVTYITRNKLASAQEIARLAAREFNFPLFDLRALEISVIPKNLVSEKLMRTHNALPLYKRGNQLFIGVSDPTNLRALEDIKFQTGLNTEPVIVVDDQLTLMLEQVLDQSDDVSQALDEDLENIDIGSGDDDGKSSSNDVSHQSDDDAPIVRYVNHMLLNAINRGASDIHFEPYEHSYRIRFRQDGVLREIDKPSVSHSPRIAARLKVMAQLDIAERRVPQDGRIKMRLSRQRAIDFRVNTLPTLFGEKVVLRILDPTSAKMGIDALGFEPDQRELFMRAIAKPQGMVLVTGPTGSGKTVSLYTALNIRNTADVNISTAEDPVEINLAGINQVNVNVKTGMTFANALRSFLRQDPDIIMVGEIRDLETAEIAIKAAQTGHLVLSTLHTNDAPQTLNRLMNMGVAPYNIASSVNLIIAQRLARRLCKECKEPDDIPAEGLIDMGFAEDEIADLEIYRPVGCEQCTGGYKGRVGIYEVMPVSEEMGRIMMSGGNAIQLAEQAQREGIKNLRQSGLNKVSQGVTSLEEVNRVTKD